MPAGPGNKYPAEHRTQNRSHQSWHGDKVQNRQQFAARIGAQEASLATGIIIAPPIPE
jgi:hypothetical protein